MDVRVRELVCRVKFDYLFFPAGKLLKLMEPIDVLHCLQEITTMMIKSVLEKGHFYQVFRVELNSIIGKIESADIPIHPEDLIKYDFEQAVAVESKRNALKEIVDQYRKLPWHLRKQKAYYERVHKRVNVSGDVIGFISNIDVYCSHPPCRGIRAHAASDATVDSGPLFYEDYQRADQCVQLIGFSHQCQSCQGEPLVTVIRRKNLELRVVGRSQIHSVPPPVSLPKTLSKWWSEASIARSVGKYEASCLYMRILVEGHMRSATGASGKVSGEDLVEMYNKRLHPEFPHSLKNLLSIYNLLSGVVHGGSMEDESLGNIFIDVERHFSMLQALPLTEPRIKGAHP